MKSAEAPGYELCYPDGRRSVPLTSDRNPDEAHRSSDRQSLATLPASPRPVSPFFWSGSAFAVVVAVVLVVLGVANVAMYSRWHEVEDGVLWGARAEGVTALDVAAGSAAAAAGI